MTTTVDSGALLRALSERGFTLEQAGRITSAAVRFNASVVIHNGKDVVEIPHHSPVQITVFQYLLRKIGMVRS